MEGALRAYAYHTEDYGEGVKSTSIHRKSGFSQLKYELNPNAETVREGVHIQINGSGFRDHEFPDTGSATGRRVVLLGDSVAWGWGVSMQEAFPQQLEVALSALARLEREPEPVVFNLAVDGYSTSQELWLLRLRGLEMVPDLVVLSYVLNDAAESQDGGLARYFDDRWQLVRLFDSARERLRETQLREPQPKDYFQRIYRLNVERTAAHFEEFGRISKRSGVPILVAPMPVLQFEPSQDYRWTDIHRSIAALCEANGLLFVDLFDAFDGRTSSDYALDVLHPNVEGHALITQTLSREIASIWWGEGR